MPARSVRTALAVAAIAVLVAGCGSSSSGGTQNTAAHSSTPVAELASSIRSLGHAQTLKLSLSLGASGAELLQIASGLGGDAPTKAQADAIGNDHIAIEIQAPAGTTLADGLHTSSATGGAFALTLGDAKADYFTLETVGGSLYGRIDLHYFLGLVNGAPSFHGLERQVAGAPAFIRAAVEGKWITLPGSTLKSFEGLATGQLGATPSAGKFAGLRSKLLFTVLADLAVTRSATGSADVLNVTFTPRRLITDEYAVVAPSLSSFVPGGSGLPVLHPADVPAVPVHLDAFVTNGSLSKVVLDAGQFDTQEHISVPIDLDIANQGPPITAPSNATPIDFSSIGQLLSGG